MILKTIKPILLFCLLTCPIASDAGSVVEEITNATYDWAKTLTGRMTNDMQHNTQRVQGKEILRPEEARNETNPIDNPDDWDFIESTKQKCWFHKRTRKKICENK